MIPHIGPWTTAALILQKRDEARKLREEQLKAAESGSIELQPETIDIYEREIHGISWSYQPKMKSLYWNDIPTLTELCSRTISENMSAFEGGFEFLSDDQRQRIAEYLAKSRKLDSVSAIQLACPNSNMISFPDCSMIDEEAMMKVIERACFNVTFTEDGNNSDSDDPDGPKNKRTSRKKDNALEEVSEILHHSNSSLQFLILRNCGRGFSDRVAAILYNGGHSLEKIELHGCYKLSDDGLVKLLDSCSSSLQSLSITANTRISNFAMQKIALSLSNLTSLALDYNTHLTDDQFRILMGLSLQPVPNSTSSSTTTVSTALPSLEDISLRGLIEISSKGLVTFIENYGKKLKGLNFSSCNVDDLVIMSIRNHCLQLSKIILENIDEMSTTALVGLFIPDSFSSNSNSSNQQHQGHSYYLRAGVIGPLEIISFQGSSNVSDDVIVQLCEQYGKTINSLNLNGCNQLTNRSMAAIWYHCGVENLQILDLSFVRACSEEAMGYLVEKCVKLRQLSVWGCTQLTSKFYHFIESSPSLSTRLKIVGRKSL